MARDFEITQEGYEQLKDELEVLSNDRRREVAARIKEAREFGDISENSEYDDAKNEQAMLESRIAEIEERLRNAQVVDTSSLTTDTVRVGSKVSTEGDGKKQTFTIVGATEAAPPEKLSSESPVAKALLGHKKGDEVEVSLPNGRTRTLKVTKIARA